MKSLSLLIPGLLGPLPELNNSNAALPECRVLNTWLARAEKKAIKCNTYYEQIAELLGVQNDFSIAQASAEYDQCDCGSGFWYRADPVHFKADMDHAILLDCQQLNIKKNEAESLIECFNQHFLADDLKLLSTHADRWYLQSKKKLEINTTCLGDAIGRNVSHFLPTGKGALNWRRLLNETQMLFHSHEVNEQRENNGQLTINSVWLWGEGEAISASENNFKWVMSDEPVSSGLATISNTELLSLTKPNAGLAKMQSDGLIIIDDIMGAVNYGDVSAWHDAVMTLCEQWLQPLDKYLKNQEIKQINLYTNHDFLLTINANKLLKFWRRPTSIINSMT